MPPETPHSPNAATKHDGWHTLKRFLPYLWPRDHPELRLRIVAAIVFTAFVTALGGALYPAIFAATTEPVEALRFE